MTLRTIVIAIVLVAVTATVLYQRNVANEKPVGTGIELVPATRNSTAPKSDDLDRSEMPSEPASESDNDSIASSGDTIEERITRLAFVESTHGTEDYWRASEKAQQFIETPDQIPVRSKIVDFDVRVFESIRHTTRLAANELTEPLVVELYPEDICTISSFRVSETTEGGYFVFANCDEQIGNGAIRLFVDSTKAEAAIRLSIAGRNYRMLSLDEDSALVTQYDRPSNSERLARIAEEYESRKQRGNEQ